jgi:ubiquinone/menaquinone biosynthesis C-methylase UbiE
MDDKQIEQQRYNNSSASLLDILEKDKKLLHVLGADNFPPYLRQPYLYYHELINSKTSASKKQLDLCCGNGMHSFTGAKNGASVIALDYADQSIEICNQRKGILKLNVDFRTADVQTLSFEDNTFDIVTCAGSLSYLNNDIFLHEVHRVLKKEGVFICVDSFNHNPVYRLNRYIHYLRGDRSYGTLVKMPNMGTIRLIRKIYSNVDVKYFGIFTFLAPVLKIFLSPQIINQIINKLDKFFPFLRRYAFKIVISATK